MNRIFSTIFSGIIGVYFIGVVFSAPVFNWNYAKDHGFWNWLFLGEIAATSKSLIWPYYIYSSFTEDEQASSSKSPQPKSLERDIKEYQHTVTSKLGQLLVSAANDTTNSIDFYIKQFEKIAFTSKENKATASIVCNMNWEGSMMMYNYLKYDGEVKDFLNKQENLSSWRNHVDSLGFTQISSYLVSSHIPLLEKLKNQYDNSDTIGKEKILKRFEDLGIQDRMVNYLLCNKL